MRRTRFHNKLHYMFLLKKLNSVNWVREQTIPTASVV
jgi:hypothetical protein